MRYPVFLLALGVSISAVSAWAQTTAPEERQPVPAVPPPPPEMAPFDEALEPQIIIRKNNQELVEEYRISGQLYMIKVTPLHGKPYYLVDTEGNGSFSRTDSLEPRLRIPHWVIKTF